MNKSVLQLSLVIVRAAELLLPIVWKIGVAAIHLLIGVAFVFLAMLIV